MTVQRRRHKNAYVDRKGKPGKAFDRRMCLRKVKSGDEERVTHRCHWSLQRSLRHYGGQRGFGMASSVGESGNFSEKPLS
tara:strand:+ start:5249 stop:5488 length:240 start_codon:yes stop_codon:yes gene_type:complete